MAKKKKKETVETSGKRKTAIARATVRKGAGRVRVNHQPIHIMEPALARRKALEPVQIAEAMNRLQDVDISVNVVFEPRLLVGSFTTTVEQRELTRNFVMSTYDSTVAYWLTIQDANARSGRSRTGDYMLIPVRCWSCGKVVAHVYEQYKQAVESGEDASKVLDDLGMEKYCCRRMFVGHIELIDEVAPFSVARQD